MATTKRRSAPRKNLPEKTDSSEKNVSEDDVLREVYAIRDAWAKEHDYDLQRIFDDLKRREKSGRPRLAGSRPSVPA